MKLVFGHDKEIADWVSKKTGSPLRNWHHAVGVIDNNGVLVGCGSYHDMNGANVEFCYYGPKGLTSETIKGFIRYAFETLGATRMTARTPRQNKIVARHLPRWGFKVEGIAKHYFGPKKRLDAIMFGLLRADAERYLGLGK